MAAVYGKLQEFQPESESIKAYLERVTLYFKANTIDDDKKVPILLSSIGSSTYATLSDLLAPDTPGTKSFEEISTKLNDHFLPKRSTIAERFQFHKRNQEVGESVAEYDAALRKLAVNCKFGTVLQETLRDRFVCGLRHEAIQRRLLSETALTYAKAIETARAMEAADQDTRAFKRPDLSVHKLSKGRFQKSKPQTSTTKHNRDQQQPCYRCGRSNHGSSECKFKDAQCHACGKTGHIASVCRSKASSVSKKQKSKTHLVQNAEQSSEESSDEGFKIHNLVKRSPDPIVVQLQLNGKFLDMEVDTGAALSVISEATRRDVFPNDTLHPSNLILKTYTNERMEVTGTLNMRVRYGNQKQKLVLVVVAGDGPSLLGRNWLKYLRLDWSNIFAVRAARISLVDDLLEKHKPLFSDELGSVKPFTASLQIQSDATPRFFKPRPVPYAIKEAVSQEISRLEEQGIISPVSHSQWAAPIVVVPKKDGRFRLCGDYKVTVNQAMNVEEYPLPTPEELFSTLSGGKIFSKLDLSQAYLQIPVDESSKPYLTVNTQRGLYVYNRLPFGVASAPAIFQRIMDTVLQGIDGVACYIDDILVSSPDEESHRRSLQEVFTRLENHGFRLKRSKCEFLLTSIEYLGHRVDEHGIHPLSSKVEAIVNAPAPENVQQLRSFLGLVNYYGKFIPNLASRLHPLNALLSARQKWNWSKECTRAFEDVKEQIVSAGVLTHYNPKLPITLAADASAYGVGAVISHVLPDGSEHPIAFASRTLTTSERNYAQIEKEALSLIFGIKKFHRFLYGRKFLLITDHKPLVAILGPKKGIPSLAAARLQRWAVILSAYNYDIKYKSTDDHGNADGLSRLPLPQTSPTCDTNNAISTFNIGQVQALPVTFQEIQQATRRDASLSKVLQYVQQGWPGQVDRELQTFFDRQTELSTENDCLLWGIRVVVPESLQRRVLDSLHANHSGITRMKATARSHFWWKGLDGDIESMGKSCYMCQSNQSSPAAAPLHPWIWPDAPWRRIHIDFAGPFLGHMFFVVVDAHSKWPEVVTMKSTTAEKTIEVMRALIAHHGIPEQVVSDNGPQFTSDEFKQFMERNRIKHILSAPYHPASNGLAERFIQTLKRALKASDKSKRSIHQRLAEFLFEYRATQHSTTGVSPAELFLKRKLRTRFDLMHPDPKKQVMSKQASQKLHHDTHVKARAFTPGTRVLARLYIGSDKWIPGTVIQQLGPVTYTVQISNGRIVKRHVNQLQPLHGNQESSDTTESDTVLDNQCYPTVEPVPEPPGPNEPERRYPLRNRHPPLRFQPTS